MTEHDFEALVRWARMVIAGQAGRGDLPAGVARWIELEADRALGRKCARNPKLTIDRARDLWVEMCFARDWWCPAVARIALAADGTDDAIGYFTAALRKRARLDAEEVHRSADLDYKWARQKLGIALRDATFSQGTILRVRWAAPPGPALLDWKPAQQAELAVLISDPTSAPEGKQAKADWLVARWRAYLLRRAEIWRVTHQLTKLEEPIGADEPLDADDWSPEAVLSALSADMGDTVLRAGLDGSDPRASGVIRNVVLNHATDDADAHLKLNELHELATRGDRS